MPVVIPNPLCFEESVMFCLKETSAIDQVFGSRPPLLIDDAFFLSSLKGFSISGFEAFILAILMNKITDEDGSPPPENTAFGRIKANARKAIERNYPELDLEEMIERNNINVSSVMTDEDFDRSRNTFFDLKAEYLIALAVIHLSFEQCLEMFVEQSGQMKEKILDDVSLRVKRINLDEKLIAATVAMIEENVQKVKERKSE